MWRCNNVIRVVYRISARAHSDGANSTQLNLLLEGAIVDAYVSDNKDAALTAKKWLLYSLKGLLNKRFFGGCILNQCSASLPYIPSGLPLITFRLQRC